VDLAARKAALRQTMAARRRARGPGLAAGAGVAVAARVEALDAFARAGRVALYAALPDELPTRPLFEAVRRHGKSALFPRLAGERLEFAPVERWEELRPGRYGVLEPPPGAAGAGWGDLVLVPGVAFDRTGHRLGRGGGTYDRTFAEAGEGVVLIGVAYEFQLVDEVPHGPGDRRLHAVVTERAFYPAGEAAQ